MGARHQRGCAPQRSLRRRFLGAPADHVGRSHLRTNTGNPYCPNPGMPSGAGVAPRHPCRTPPPGNPPVTDPGKLGSTSSILTLGIWECTKQGACYLHGSCTSQATGSTPFRCTAGIPGIGSPPRKSMGRRRVTLIAVLLLCVFDPAPAQARISLQRRVFTQISGPGGCVRPWLPKG